MATNRPFEMCRYWDGLIKLSKTLTSVIAADELIEMATGLSIFFPFRSFSLYFVFLEASTTSGSGTDPGTLRKCENFQRSILRFTKITWMESLLLKLAMGISMQLLPIWSWNKQSRDQKRSRRCRWPNKTRSFCYWMGTVLSWGASYQQLSCRNHWISSCQFGCRAPSSRTSKDFHTWVQWCRKQGGCVYQWTGEPWPHFSMFNIASFYLLASCHTWCLSSC